MADGTTETRPLGPLRVPPVSSRPPVASAINRQLAGNSDNITLSRDEATEAVLTLARCSTNEAELDRVSAELRRYKFYADFGDYAGRVYNRVMKATANAKDLPSTVSKLRDMLAKEISTMPPEGGKLCEALRDSINTLSSTGLSVDFDMVQLAINAYSARNKVLHSELSSREVADDLEEVSRLVDRDQAKLLRVLPDDQFEHLGSWRKILDFYTRSQEIAVGDANRKKFRENLPDDVRQLAQTDAENALHSGKFRQLVEQVPVEAKSRPRNRSDTTSDQVPPRKRKASVSLDPESTESAGQTRGKPQRRLTKKEVKFNEQSEALMNRLKDWHCKDPRRALQWVNKISDELNKELSEQPQPGE